ncbi:hypothetical protein Leryth_021741 [Lithospermum erythrorhizon]|nr:hypothetical protein Leryth_021741 [Lithospermum erythrorhizon]
MKSSVILDSAVFHLTPTRTRCDLIIMSHEKQEKIGSGLLNPFVAHLKTAQEQIAKGGYSIVLEPQRNRDTSWFTKGTLERFVRFVSTPEILERVYSIESEILQIEEAIVMQGKNDLDCTHVSDSQGKYLGSQHGSKLVPDQANEEKAIILYEPGVQQPKTDHKVPPEGNSRVQLLKVLETRINVLQKEQGMAFARAVAAGFELDHMSPLLSFAECFGAERLMDACKKFMDLWKKKHETGQWLEIDTPVPVLNQSEYLAMSASGIMLASVANKHQSCNDVGSDNNEGRAQNSQVNSSQHEHFQGQFPHPMFSSWPMHSPGTVPVFPSYPIQGMPYYPTYPGNGPYYHPAYPANRDSESEMSEVGLSRSGSLEAPVFTKESRKKAGRPGKKKSGVVVIRNVNYITSEANADASIESGSGSGYESELSCNEDHTSPYKTSNKKDRNAGSMYESVMLNKEVTSNGKDSDAGHWQAFQSLLLERADEENVNNKDEMFVQEQDAKMLRRLSLVKDDDPVSMGGRGVEHTNNFSNDEIQEISGNMLQRNIGSNDDFLLSEGPNDGGRVYNCSVDMQSTETNGKRVIARTACDDFVFSGRRSQSDRGNLVRLLLAGKMDLIA